MLIDYLRALGLPGLDDRLLAVTPDQPAILFGMPAREGTLPSYSLDEVKRGVPWMRRD